MRSNNRIDLRLPMFVALCLIVLGLMMRQAQADEWTPADQPCSPTKSEFHSAYLVELPLGALVWWCDMPAGIETRFIAGTATNERILAFVQAQVAKLILSGTDPLPLIKAAIVREATPAEQAIVDKIEAAQEPRCYITGTAATASVLTQTAQGTIGPAKLDASGAGIRVAVAGRIDCAWRLAKETAKRYCSAENLIDTKGRKIEGDAWALCKIERAPSGGWPK